ncbi:YheC/YheD family protein [Paenibacillus faecalis]|uniref:YheC/YheD family endospore coat-associated protein n=1 Tax=Paenibacillus faecalis TaxID=2079532 RepID=UPI001F3F7A41|nr:YheC/YheD family protein [Paenibacillus faecalis]
MIHRVEEDTKPVVAILTMHDSERQFRGNRQNFHEIIKTGKDKGYLVYVVTVRDLKLKADTIRGFISNGDPHTWEQRMFPLPQVIYNRIPYREDEIKPRVRRKIKQCILHPHIEIYNPFFFNKRKLITWLCKSQLTRKWAPITKKLKGLPSLYDMIRRCSYLYLKPEEGKAGQGIMRLKYQKSKPMPYRLQIQNNKNSITYKSASLERVWGRICKETKGAPYIIQQGIELTAVHGRAFDLRLLVQKSDLGVWGVTGIGARMAGTRSITTHVPRGGTIEDPEKLLPSLFGSEETEVILNKVRNAAVHIAKQIEWGCRYKLGEMSMDLGLDTSGGLWFFEANSRPMKFDEPSIRKRSLERIFDYCDYLIEKQVN